MGLDIRFIHQKAVICPHCGEVVSHQHIREMSSSGRAWYPFLKSIGYYVPYEERTKEHDWYAKDMILTSEQMLEACAFIRENYDLYNANDIHGLIASAIVSGEGIAVNADW